MYIEELFITALTSLAANKLRAFLTMLGVIIGVFSVIALVSLGKGLENYITDEFNALGTNLIFVSPGKVSTSNLGGDPATLLSRNKLDEKHIDLIKIYGSEYLEEVSPYIILGDTVRYKTNSYFAEITGVSAKSISIVNYDITQGRAFTNAEVKGKSKVAVIGPIIQKELFGIQNSINRRIKVGTDTYTVIGVFAEKGSNYDDQIIVPYTSAVQTFDIKNYSSLFAKVTSADKIDIAMKQVELAVGRDLTEEEFTVLSQKDFLDSIQDILGILTLGLSAIAGISLLVGGIGIMNIMLVTVTERIREIGLRKAIGATPLSIASQFLIESVLLSVTGGTIGLIFGWLVTIAVQNYIRAEIPISAVFMAFGFSVLVGVTFGTYPAISAGKLDPIEALRYE